MPRAARRRAASAGPTSATPRSKWRDRGERAVDDVARRVVAAHGVDGDPDHRVRSGLERCRAVPVELFLVDRARLAAAVVAAVRADAVRRLRLVAVRAFAEARPASARRASGAWPSASWSVVVLDSASRPLRQLSAAQLRLQLSALRFQVLQRREPRVLPLALAVAGAACSGSSRRPGTGPGSRRGTAASSAATDRTARASAARGRSRRSRKTPSSDRPLRSRARLSPVFCACG